MSIKFFWYFKIWILVFTSVSPALATTYYVSSTGNTTNDGKTVSTPFLTIQQASNLTIPGDSVLVMNGVYTTTSGPLLSITRSGTAGAWITYKAMNGHSPKITASGNVWNAVSINGSYVVFEGFELMGNNANLTYEAALKSYNDQVSGVSAPNPVFNTNGLSIGGLRDESKKPHHVIIRSCKVHDFPGGGISAIQTDYTTIENNLVFNNAWYMVYGGSGISVLTPYNSDQVSTYKIIVRNNTCFSNKTTIPWISLKRLSDGNGIIIDINQYPYGGKVGDEMYVGRTLVKNNLSVNNGGSGIHAYRANHVDMINNTVYQNGTVLSDYANIFANDCVDVNIINNISYAAMGKNCNSTNRNVNVVYDYNLYFNGIVAVKGPHDRIADPEFVNPSSDRIVANFQLKESSPAIDQATQTAGFFSQKDILGVARPHGLGPDIGAYEFTNALQEIITSVVSLPIRHSARVYPNPAKESLTMQLPEDLNSNVDVEILDCRGTSLKKQNVSQQSTDLNIQSLASGLYVLVVSENNRVISVHTFVKEK
ncbi:T9SS type A sorting domain-containing protein [Arundinibacter roseus]|uniref:T9SS type A sorting domain-containing protein n=1 Tax=Arundinibacter roseus TaxID=2070510 RepID=A0A4R4KHH5_9BACT|nr:T9SS type A sorting domain-containing protein [Arundinibacter roseus]TDB67488.1 T9SS type A sorting domain-containing protein [Arundinibacter roseus]